MLGAGLIDHCNQVHVVLGIKQAGINVILGTPVFEHAITFGAKRP
jgi:hypothetical protein